MLKTMEHFFFFGFGLGLQRRGSSESYIFMLAIESLAVQIKGNNIQGEKIVVVRLVSLRI